MLRLQCSECQLLVRPARGTTGNAAVAKRSAFTPRGVFLVRAGDSYPRRYFFVTQGSSMISGDGCKWLSRSRRTGSGPQPPASDRRAALLFSLCAVPNGSTAWWCALLLSCALLLLLATTRRPFFCRQRRHTAAPERSATSLFFM